jgi:hypothetical protein
MKRRFTRFHVLLCVATAASAVGLLGGCASRADGPREFSISPGGYPAAFDATRRVLREMDFELARVDAAAGVISTSPHYSQGLLEPWDSTQSGFADEWEDAVNRQSRLVRVTFAPVGGGADDGTTVDGGEGVVGSVWVTLFRTHRSGRRLDSEWVGASTSASDPLQKQRHTSVYSVPIRRDTSLEGRLAARIAEEINQSSAHASEPTGD